MNATFEWSVEREIDRWWIEWIRDRCSDLDSDEETVSSVIFLFKQGSDVEWVTFDPDSLLFESSALQLWLVEWFASDLKRSIFYWMLQWIQLLTSQPNRHRFNAWKSHSNNHQRNQWFNKTGVESKRYLE